MGYFVTGGTGFIGRHLVALLAARGEPVYVLLRKGSGPKLERIAVTDPAQRKLVIPIEGDLGSEHLGIDPSRREQLRGSIRHFFHLGALYDLGAEAPELERANVAGTRNALDLAHAIKAGCFHLASSIAVAGEYPGRFSEQMFTEATGLDHPYFRTKHASEALVRDSCRLPWRIYRPGMVIGHSVTGVMDKVDGPYYLFKLIQRLRELVPRWLSLPGFRGGHINLVPVDFVASALDYLAHVPGHDGGCFHLTDPQDRRIGEVLNLFAHAAHAPTMSLHLDPLLAVMPSMQQRPIRELLPSLRRIVERLSADLGIPPSALGLLQYPTSFDATGTQTLLAKAGIRLPRLEEYAWRLWDYWERHLDLDAHDPAHLARAVAGKSVLITGGSSGIGRATALRLAQTSARLLVVARDPVKLAALRAEIEAGGGRVHTYSCDIGEAQDCDRFLAQLLAEHGQVDILINNAGRSIRRAVENSFDRQHDYERLMRINYHAAVRVTLGLLPAMLRRGGGHVINISSIGVLGNSPRFAGYAASKAALEAFSRCAAAEFRDRGIRFTVINMPLVRTPMVAPTRLYEQLKLLTPDDAAGIVCQAIVTRPDRLTTGLGTFAMFAELVSPAFSRAVNAESFKLFRESEAASASPGAANLSAAGPTASKEVLAFASLLQGIHW
jgi:NAD(P)-dependent dehydrogenase (short-subunit alcohol dehydrogenase family)